MGRAVEIQIRCRWVRTQFEPCREFDWALVRAAVRRAVELVEMWRVKVASESRAVASVGQAALAEMTMLKMAAAGRGC